MTDKQAEYLVATAFNPFGLLSPQTEWDHRVRETRKRLLSDDEKNELIGLYPDFPRDNE